MSQKFSFNPPSGSSEDATTYVKGALEALAGEGTLKPRQVCNILLCNLTENTLYLLALYQVQNHANLVVRGLAAAQNKYFDPLNTIFRDDPILAILLRSEAGKEALFMAFHVTSRTVRCNFDPAQASLIDEHKFQGA